MSNRLIIWPVILVLYLCSNALLAESQMKRIVQTPNGMSAEKVETFFTENNDADGVTWVPLENGTTRLGLNIPRLGFERALEFQDGNSLFYLSDVEDLGFHLHKLDMFFLRFKLGSDGYLMQVSRDIHNGLAGGMKVEYLDKFRSVGFLDKTIVHNSAMFSSRLGFGLDGSSFINGQAVQLSLNERSELFSWVNFSIDNDDRSFGFGKTWFDLQYDFDSTLLTHWDSMGWKGGFLLNKSQGEGNFAAGLVDVDKNLKPKFYVEFSIPLENLEKLSSKISLKSGKLKSQYLPQRSLKSFRRKELALQWRNAMDFSLEN